MVGIHHALATVARVLNSVNEGIGRGVAWTAFALVVIQLLAVVLRYVFGVGWIWVEESIVYLHATLFMTGAAYALLKDGHVRVDVFYREASTRDRAKVDLFGTVFFLWPVCALILVKSWPYVTQSWVVLERSPETSGIPAVFVLKSLIPIFAALMIVQGVSMAAAALLVILGRTEAAR